MPALHSMHEVEVLYPTNSGFYVRIPGCKVDCFVHHSQISRKVEFSEARPCTKEAIQKILNNIGGKVFVKVVYVGMMEDKATNRAVPKCECSLTMVRSTHVLSCWRFHDMRV